MEVGIDSFASHLLQNGGDHLSGTEAMRLLLERIRTQAWSLYAQG